MQTSVISQRQGFSLIELLIVVAIVGILAAVAYPNYTSYVLRSRRADATAALTAIVQAQERYRGNRSSFSSSLADLKVNVAAITNHYDVSITNLDGVEDLVSGYVVTATPARGSPQQNDKDCQSLSIRVDGASVNYLAVGQGDRVTSSTCWPR
jgi:type IV pilus assembly protein PilE